MDTTNAFHIGLHVRDIEESEKFYSSLLGLTPIKQKSDYLKYETANPGLVLTFNKSEKPEPTFGHLGFRVPSKSELSDYKERVLNSNLSITEEEDVNCCYANQDKFWVVDPDGYRWEIFVFNNDVEVNETKDVACCDDISCC